MSSVISDYTQASDGQTVDFGTWSPGYKALDIFVNIKHNGLAADYELFINADYTAGNYYTQHTLGSAANLTGGEFNNADIANIGINDSWAARILMMVGPSRCIWQASILEHASDSSITARHRGVVYAGTNPSTITNLRFTNQRPVGIAAGSRIIIRDLSV